MTSHRKLINSNTSSKHIFSEYKSIGALGRQSQRGEMWAAKISFWKSLITNAKSVVINPVAFYDNNISINRDGVDNFIIGIM